MRVTNFQKTRSTGTQAVNQQHNLYINPKICINEPDLLLPTSIKSRLRHRGILYSLLFCLSLADSDKQKSRKIMTHIQATKNLHHSGVRGEAALRPEDASTQGVSMLSTILELSPFGNFSSAQDNYGNRSSLISTFSYAMAIDHS